MHPSRSPTTVCSVCTALTQTMLNIQSLMSLFWFTHSF